MHVGIICSSSFLQEQPLRHPGGSLSTSAGSRPKLNGGNKKQEEENGIIKGGGGPFKYLKEHS